MSLPSEDQIVGYLASVWSAQRGESRDENVNKVVGALAEIRFLQEVVEEFHVRDRVVDGCWILVPPKPDFYNRRIAFFLCPLAEHSLGPPVRAPQPVIQAALSLKGLGIKSHYAIPFLGGDMPFEWKAIDISAPNPSEDPVPMENFMTDFPKRKVRTPQRHVSRRVVQYLQRFRQLPRDLTLRALGKQLFLDYLARTWVRLGTVDVDYFLFGAKYGMPIEIKEKTPASDETTIGRYFGIDVGPFVKLAFFLKDAAKAFDAIFAVREIDDEERRDLIAWKYITFRDVLDSMYWVGIPGGESMAGFGSHTIKIPYGRFKTLTAQEMERLIT